MSKVTLGIGEGLVDAVAMQPITLPELENAELYLETHLPEIGLLSHWQGQTIMALLDPAGPLVAELFAQAGPLTMSSGW